MAIEDVGVAGFGSAGKCMKGRLGGIEEGQDVSQVMDIQTQNQESLGLAVRTQAGNGHPQDNRGKGMSIFIQRQRIKRFCDIREIKLAGSQCSNVFKYNQRVGFDLGELIRTKFQDRRSDVQQKISSGAVGSDIGELPIEIPPGLFMNGQKLLQVIFAGRLLGQGYQIDSASFQQTLDFMSLGKALQPGGAFQRHVQESGGKPVGNKSGDQNDEDHGGQNGRNQLFPNAPGGKFI